MTDLMLVAGQVAAVVVAASAVPMAPLAPNAEADDLRAQLERSRQEIALLETGAISAWDRTVPVLEAQIVTLTETNRELVEALEEAQARLESEERAIAQLRVAVADRDRRLAGENE